MMMRNGRCGVALGVLLGLVGVMPAGGCDTTWDDYYKPLTDPKLATGGEVPAKCVPRENKDPVADTCGIFVSSSKGDDTSGDGTKGASYKTLAMALSKGGGKPVYVCGESFKEAVTLSAGGALFGALDCTNDWTYDASKKTSLTGDPDAIPLTVTNAASSAEVHDFAITAADAMKDGGSSIAIIVGQIALLLESVDVTAGVGTAGVNGAAQGKVMTPAMANGGNGDNDAACNVTNLIPGGVGGTNTCNGVKTDGGNGGRGLPESNGGLGVFGQPTGAMNGGAGQTSTTQCQPGQQGTQGITGMNGTSARGLGDISSAGYQAPAATSGMAGSPGQGGGGGGGARQCDAGGMFAGPSGGGGGAGGCGGAPGNPGQTGGSSIGIVASGAMMTLKRVTITTKDGGVGGVGGDGQPGGDGGQQGNQGGSGACPGGPGGQGGAGGLGGNGAGGHSIGIAYTGMSMPSTEGVTFTKGTPGAGGKGADAMHDGAAGVQADVQAFP